MFEESKFEFKTEEGEIDEGSRYIDDKLINFSNLQESDPYF